MNARTFTTCVVTLALLCFGAPPVFAEKGAEKGDDSLAADLRAAVAGNIAAYDREDAAGTMSFVHTKSPDYDTTKEALTEQFKDLDVTAELVDFGYIGHDDEFAVGRVKMKTSSKPPGTETDFTNNTVDSIVVFHQENGAWKLWSQQVLGIDLGK